MKQYDYIFIGAGCAGLSLLTRMIHAGLCTGKRILLIDKSDKQSNDRTWCFWEKGEGFFEPLVSKQWNHLWFHSPGFSRQLQIAPYHYKMIRGLDFYQHCFSIIRQRPEIEIINGTVSALTRSEKHTQLRINNIPHEYMADIVFTSLWSEAAARAQKAVYLLQHFKGWMIETDRPFFDGDQATLMDFRIDQQHGTSFVYVLPLSATRALVEYTLFSEKLLPPAAYDEGLANYMHEWLKTDAYTVAEEEFGVIPMTNARFPWYANGCYHIGTAGGQTKASSGYTFQFIQKQSAAIVAQLQKNGLSSAVRPATVAARYPFYDAVLLRVLQRRSVTGSKVFSSMFKNNTPQSIFAFLDNESSLQQDISIIATLPTLPFARAAVKELLHLPA
ncbi:MAG TPA: lycopene cyclase family protein [Chitinophagaceae bacterium]|nr:lycopene cyclase family protein [Chitinophagaceae bacterium]